MGIVQQNAAAISLQAINKFFPMLAAGHVLVLLLNRSCLTQKSVPAGSMDIQIATFRGRSDVAYS